METVTFETGKLAQCASGAVVLGMGDTRVLVTAVADHSVDERRDFYLCKWITEKGNTHKGKYHSCGVKEHQRNVSFFAVDSLTDQSVLSFQRVSFTIHRSWLM
jgi:hypothetical protein